jgi:hypothetical protein
MTQSVFAAVLACPLAWRCAGSFPPPTRRLADAQAVERGAREVGADTSPAAQLSLKNPQDQIAKAEKASAAGDQKVSRKRAQAVRDYLVTRGIAANRVVAQGFGPTRSLADNKSPEGRANNRRVEIAVQPAASR